MKTKRYLSLFLAILMALGAIVSTIGILIMAASAEDATHGYVAEGLVSLYDGQKNGREGHNLDAAVWEDLVGQNDLTIQKNDKNFFTEAGLSAEGAKHTFPQGIVDTVNGQEFTVELHFSEFVSLGTTYNTFLNSSNDNLALFRRNNTNQIEFKFARNSGGERHKIDDGLNLLQNALITVTYKVGGTCYIYINGVLMAEKPSPNAMGANDLYIGHDDGSKTFNTTFRSMRFYSRALTEDEVKANARADGYTVPESNIPVVETPGYVTVAQPKTNIAGDISMVRRVGSADELTAVTSAEKKPAVAIFTVNADLNVISDKGSVIDTVGEVLEKTDFKILPALYVETAETATALVTYLKDLRFYDCLVVSNDPAVVKQVRNALPTVSGVIDYTATYRNETALTEAQCLDIRRSMKENNGTIAMLPAALCQNETVQYLYTRQVNVWAVAADAPSVTAQYNALLSGAIGVVSDATDALLDIACNKLPASTMTRVTTNTGHRGIPAKAPENTLEGSILAFELGADVIELDVYLTTDGEVVVMHDGDTARTCNKALPVEGSTLAQLKELYVNKGYESNEKFKNCRIPTLKEYLEYFKGKDCNLFIEIKSGKTEIVKATKALVDEYEMYNQCTVITFNEPIMQAMRKDWPEMHVGALCSGFMGGSNPEAELRDAMSFIGKYNASLNPSMGGFDEADIVASLKRGISIYPWTFRGDLNTYKSYFLWGYSGLTGDNADVLGILAKDVQYTGKTEFAVGESVDLQLAVTNYLRATSDRDVTVTVLEGDKNVTQDGSTMTFTAAGEVTLLLSYNQRLSRNEGYHLYTQPITVTVTDGTTTTDTAVATTDASASEDTTVSVNSSADAGTEMAEDEGCASVMGVTAFGIILLSAGFCLRRRDEE